MLAAVSVSAVAVRTAVTVLSAESEYVTLAFTPPGKPWSPAGLVSANVTESAVVRVTFQRRMHQPPSAPPP